MKRPVLRLPWRPAPTTHDLIFDHYSRFWTGAAIEEVHWTPGHVSTRLPDLHIVKVPPFPSMPMWTFATIGAWRATEQEPHGLEFVAVARDQSASVLMNMAIAAYYHAGPPENRLGLNHTVEIGEGWVQGSPLTSVLVSRPYLWGPALEHCQLPDRHIQVLWLVPITADEHEFIRAHGVDQLEQRFESTSFDYLDPFRQSVVAN